MKWKAARRWKFENRFTHRRLSGQAGFGNFGNLKQGEVRTLQVGFFGTHSSIGVAYFTAFQTGLIKIGFPEITLFFC